MRSYYALSNEDLAELFVGARGGYLPTSSEALEGDVERHLRAGRMIHRLPDVPEIARAVRRIAAELADEQEPVAPPVMSAEQAAWQENLRQGTTADDAALQYADELALAGQVKAMSLGEFAAQRERFGLAKPVG